MKNNAHSDTVTTYTCTGRGAKTVFRNLEGHQNFQENQRGAMKSLHPLPKQEILTRAFKDQYENTLKKARYNIPSIWTGSPKSYARLFGCCEGLVSSDISSSLPF